MGEYAKFGGDEVKIGTCENMYYLRADQAHKVTPVRGNVDPVRQAADIRFRFPFPDEDCVAPGAFGAYDRGLTTDVPCPADVEHETMWRANVPKLPCPGGKVEIIQQRLVDGALVLVCRCSVCEARYRVPTFDEARVIVESLVRQAEREKRADLLVVASRIVDGYEGRHAFGAYPTCDECGQAARVRP
jgi:hypothetical protein